MVQNMCQAAGILGEKTNHSLRATGASRLFQASVPEKIIQERTGHRSTDSLRLYKRTADKQHRAIFQILGSKVAVSYTSVLQDRVEEKQTTIRQPMEQPANIAPVFNMSGCTINIAFNQAPPPLPSLSEITQEEVDQLFQGYP